MAELGKVAVMAVDPGGKTGVAWGRFDLSKGGIADVVASGKFSSATLVGDGTCGGEREKVDSVRLGDDEPFSVGPCDGSELAMAHEVARLYYETLFYWNVRMGMLVTDYHLVFEDFVLRAKVGDRSRHTLSPARIYGMVAALVGFEPPRQMPSEAITRFKTARLKKAGLWVVGREHERDARRHMALKLVRLGQRAS